MALRVLLADESPTIKKVFKLSLQDYGAEIRVVTSGLDVARGIQDFNPDIIFSDVLLPKKNGYDVCTEIKSDSTLNSIPYIMMWSSFMDIDQEKFNSSGADDKLEKPFEAEQLRDLIQKHVRKTEEQELSQYLDLPELPDMKEEIKSAVAKSEAINPQIKETLSQPPSLQLEDEDSEVADDFSELSLPLSGAPEITRIDDADLFSDTKSESTDWSDQGLSDIKLSTDPDEDENLSIDELIAPAKVISQAKDDSTHTDKLNSAPQEHNIDIHNFIGKDEIENIIREQATKVIENIAWKIMPELATQIIERELHRLIDEKNSKEI